MATTRSPAHPFALTHAFSDPGRPLSEWLSAYYVRTQASYHARSRAIACELAAGLMVDYGKDSLTGTH